jgi:outer membrane receptor protein involved in Fe transport
LGATLLLAGPTWAQESTSETAAAAATPEPAAQPAEAPNEPAESFFATTTVTATGYKVDTFEIVNPVNIISAEDIEIAAPQNAADMLRSEPGVDVDGIGPNQSRPIIRGQRGLRVLFLEDGLRMNNPRRQTDFGEIPGLVDIDSVATMEVVRGPSSVLYGSDAIGGVINLVTNNPIMGESLRGGVQLRTDTGANSKQGGGNIAGSFAKAAYQLGFTSRSFDDYSAPAGTFGNITLDDSAKVVDSGLTDKSLWGTLGFALGDSHDLRFRLNRYRADDAGFGFVEPDLLGEGDDFRIRILYPFQDFDRLSAIYSGTGFETPWIDSLEAKVYYQNNERQLANDIDINIGPIFPGAPNSFVFADTKNFTDIESTGVRLEALKTVGGKHLITYGLDAYEDDSFNTDASVTTTQLNFPGPPFTVLDVSEDTLANAPNATNSSFGVFVQGDFAVGDRWKLAAGVRDQTVTTKAQATPGWDISGLDFDDRATVASASALYRATDNVHLVASYGTAFRAPNIIERLFNGLTPEGAGFQILNPDLVSENSETVDVGLKYRRKQALFELNYFQNDISDGIIQYFLSPAEIAQLPQATQDIINQTGVDFVVQERNIDRLRYEGLELLVRYRLGDDWTLGGNYTYLDGKRVDSTNPPTGDTFGDKVILYTRYQPADGRWWGEYRVRHNGDDKANLDPGEPIPPVGPTLPAFTVHTLAGGVLLHEGGQVRHELALTIDNLTNELYAEFSNSTFFRPQPERRAIATYRLRF